MPGIDSLTTLLQEELKDIYDAERQLTKALPKMAKKAAAEELKRSFEEHLRITEQQIERLEQVFEQLELPARAKRCEGMRNLIKEGEDMMREAEDDATRDALIIASAQKIEHYEIAAYGTLRTWANLLGQSEVASSLEETLDEEKEADQRLTQIAESFINQAAAQGGGEEEEESGSARSGGGSRSARGSGSRRKSASRSGGGSRSRARR